MMSYTVVCVARAGPGGVVGSRVTFPVSKSVAVCRNERLLLLTRTRERERKIILLISIPSIIWWRSHDPGREPL